MRERKRQPTHPGGIIKRHYLEPLSLNVSQVAKQIRISRKTFSKIINERGSITSEMALRLSQAFKTTPQFWLNLQQNYDLWHAAHKSNAWKKIHAIAS